MQVDSVKLDVKLKLVVPGNCTPIAKRIPASTDFAQLVSKAKALAAKHNMLDDKDPIITYKDESEWENLEVEDDDDLELALAKAMTSDSKSITFFIKTSQSVAQEDFKPVANPDDEEMKGDDDEAPVKGKKNKIKNPKMPRKALKNLINSELEKQSREVFTELLKSKDLDGAMPEQKKTDMEAAQDHVVHTGVQCDGCGVSPIVGIRYKCSVLKDFDYCQLCEERLNHDHPFLKIKEAGGAPDVLITMLDEAESDAKPPQNDLENLVKQFTQNFTRDGGFGPRGGRGGRGGRGCRGGRGGMGGMGGMPFKQMISDFVEKMGGNPAEIEKHMKNFGGCGGDNPVWRQKRAQLIKSPEVVIEAIPGQCVIAEIEVLNDTYWPWK